MRCSRIETRDPYADGRIVPCASGTSRRFAAAHHSARRRKLRGHAADIVQPTPELDSSRAVPILNEKDEVVEWFGAALDVTARKNAEDALREADRRKDEFLAMLAHELRNPLAPIRNALYLLKTTEVDRSSSEDVRSMMERQVEHLARLSGGTRFHPRDGGWMRYWAQC